MLPPCKNDNVVILTKNNVKPPILDCILISDSVHAGYPFDCLYILPPGKCNW